VTGFGSAVAVGLCLTFCVGGSAWSAEAAPSVSRPLVADPSVRRGVLPNGLRYAVVRNATPKGGLSLRLAFDVGSLDETDAERGAAHFVEHMAFRGTRNFPDGQLDPIFAPMGVGFGRDQNAVTGLEATLYRLDLPEADAARRATALRWLRDVADGVRFDPEAVERERGVVLAEREARNEPEAEVRRAIDAFAGPELLATRRPPIGDLQVVRTISAAQLRAFYAQWYRPEHAALVVVGDGPAIDGVEAELARAFEDWRPAGAAPKRAVLPGPDPARGLSAFTLATANVAPGIAVCRVRAVTPDPVRDLAGYRQVVLRAIWSTAMETRLSDLALADPHLLAAGVSVIGSRESSETCLNASSAGEDWRSVLKTLQLEARRFSEGIGEPEIEATLRQIRAKSLGQITLSASMDSAAMATEIASQVLANEVVMAPREGLRSFNQAVETLTPAEVAASWRREWSGSGPFISLVMAKPPTREAVLAAWAENEKLDAGAYAQRAVPEWAYGAAGAPGSVARREVMTAPDFIRLRFANGVVLNFKQTAFAKGAVQVRVDFGDGREELGTRTEEEGHQAADSFVLGGLGRHSYADLLAMTDEEALDFELVMSNRSFFLRADAFRSRLPEHLRLMAAYLADPGFRDDYDAKLSMGVANRLRADKVSPNAAITEGLREVIDLQRGSEAEMLRLGARDFAAILRPAVTTAPLEVTLVGDVDEETAIALVAATLGALPPRPSRPKRPAYSGYDQFAKGAPERVAKTHAGPADKAAVAVVWPVFVFSSERRREEYALELLTAVFDDNLRHSIRERLGKAYAPAVALDGNGGDQGFLMAWAEVAPGDLAMVEAEIRDLSGRLARGDITPEALDAARRPMLAMWSADQNDNDWWAGALRRSAREPTRPVELVRAPEILGQLTLEEVKTAAARWLGARPFVIVATPESRK